jgi:dihydropteroate synthase
VDALLKQAEKMLAEGAAILDIGGESTRPGSNPVTAEEEQARVLQAVAAVKKQFPDSILSVDTYRAALAREALAQGADIVNDISALTADPGMAAVVAEAKAPVILMHRKGTPKDMQQQCHYKNVVQEVTEYLLDRAGRVLGTSPAVFDDAPSPTGTGKDASGKWNGKTADATVLPPEERLEGSLAVTAAAVYTGASLVRVHDVKEHVRLIRMLEAIRKV